MTYEELQEKIRQMPLPDRMDKAAEMIGEMCKNGRPPKISLPVSADDEDVFITTTLQDAKAQLIKLSNFAAITMRRMEDVPND